MNPLYNAGIALYDLGIAVASARSAKVAHMRAGRRHTLDTLAETRRRVAPDGFDVWMHAASLGEFEQGRPVIERIRRECPDMKILLTFFSPSGYEVRHDYPLADAVEYLPSDSPAAVRRFLDAAAPRRAIFIKYEFWGNYLGELRRRGIPTYIISSIFRPAQRFFRAGGGMFRDMLRCFTHIFVQDDDSRRLLAAIGIKDVTVAGDTRFDRVTDILRSARPLPELEAWTAGAPFTFIAGSSWEPDEDVYIPWLVAHPEVRAIVAPHEFDAARLETLRRRLAPACLLSEAVAAGGVPEGCRAVVVDSFGLLSSLYRLADMACVGGGFGAGIHNINEAAVYGIPVVFGPRHHKFKEAADLIAAGGAFEIAGRDDFAALASRLLADADARRAAGAAAGDYISRSVGASDIVFDHIFKHR
ncbi:MAG: 3-deoxy-D-manno-octulosonic acid transferase [Bacteroides sp.]|nr:3-deoxy-D-manno-octulosonic acid transferase [Bacteroides sp.]